MTSAEGTTMDSTSYMETAMQISTKKKFQSETVLIQTNKQTTIFFSFFFFPFLLLRFVLKGFTPDGRDLSDKETKALLAAGDKDGDGKIGADGM